MLKAWSRWNEARFLLNKAMWFEETAPVAISPGAGYFLHQDSAVWQLHDPSEMSCEERSVLQEQRSDCELGTWSAGLSYSGMDQREAVVIPQHCQGPLLLERCFATKIQHQTASSHDSRNGGREKREVRSETGAPVGSCIFLCWAIRACRAGAVSQQPANGQRWVDCD